MPNTDQNSSIIETGSLTDRQVQDIRRLTDICCRHDHLRLSYPVDEGDEADGDDPAGSRDSSDSGDSAGTCGARHWLCYQQDGLLCCALGLVYYQDSLAECVAFTHPDFRRQGLFSRVFELALNRCGDRDIIFTVSGHCPDTTAALQALGAEPESQEYQMELDLETVFEPNPNRNTKPHSCTLSPSGKTCSLRKSGENIGSENQEHTTTWLLTDADDCSGSHRVPDVSGLCPMPTVLGSCQTSRVSDSCACLHHVEILPALRRQGCSYALLRLLLPALYEEGVRRLILQVSGDNHAALALYKKTGFRITETLSCYLY